MTQAQTNYQVALKLYASADEKGRVEELMRGAGFDNMSDYLRHCVEVEVEKRGEQFKFSPRNWGGYRPRRQKQAT